MDYAVVVAAGSGTRMQSEIPKQFLLLGGRPVLWYAVSSFLEYDEAMKVILVLAEEQMSRQDELKNYFENSNRIEFVAGGSNRFESVRNGLRHIDSGDLVFIHDAVRPFIGRPLIERCAACARQHGSAIPVRPVSDSIRKIDANGSVAVDRSIFRQVQTPQTFQLDLIKKAFQQNFNALFTDEASVLEAYGHPVALCEGDDANIKLTRPIDLLWAESYLKHMTLLG